MVLTRKNERKNHKNGDIATAHFCAYLSSTWPLGTSSYESCWSQRHLKRKTRLSNKLLAYLWYCIYCASTPSLHRESTNSLNAVAAVFSALNHCCSSIIIVWNQYTDKCIRPVWRTKALGLLLSKRPAELIHSAADRGEGGGGADNRGSLPQAPSAELFQGSLFHPSLVSLRGPFRRIVDFKSACFFFVSRFHCWRKL